ncbi:MAG: penicillin-binding protein activator [Nitrosomonas sp.]|nr:MAG: penicillin-binding protein activator [Nitrosomonas sp.]
MQHYFSIFLVLIVVLYGTPSAFSTHPENYYVDDQASGTTPMPHIALLLPLHSPSFGEAAEVVRQGFVTATMRGEALPVTIRIYATTDDPLDILVSYREALYAGAIMVVGPLTRDGVSALASSRFVTVPTLTLNTADNIDYMSPNLYLFGLQMENEASQVADLASRENRHHAIIINSNSPLSTRLKVAFTEEWRKNNTYATVESIQFSEDQTFLRSLREFTAGEDAIVFLALGAKDSRLIRSYLNPSTPIYATSQIFISNNDALFNHDLNNTNFMDMPWLLQPDHPAVMAYKHYDTAMSKDQERLYALGIDAFRLMALMMRAHSAYEISLDGVTGHVYFVPPNQFIRESIPARFKNGKAVLINANTYQGLSISER